MTRATLALLLSGCGGIATVDMPPDCILPHNSPESSCNPPTPTYQVCWPGDGTYWILYDSGERVHQTLGKTAHVPVLCHVAEDGTVTLNWKDGL